MIEGPLNVDQAAQLAGVASKTIRRAIQDGRLPAEIVKGGRHRGYRITREDLVSVFGTGGSVEKSAPRSPVQEMAGEIAQLREALEAIQATNEHLVSKVTTLESEVRDSRGQLAQLQTEILKALPAPSQKQGFFARLFGSNSGSK